MTIDFEGVPPMPEIREAISRGREPYIRAAEQLDVINSNAAQDLNHGRDVVPLAIAFSEINNAQVSGYLQPPLTDELAGLVADTNAALSGVSTSVHPEAYDLNAGQSYKGLENARFLLRIIIDYGSRSTSVFVREKFDASAHERVHRDTSFEAKARVARIRRVAAKRQGS